MKRTHTLVILCAMLAVSLARTTLAAPRILELALQTRDPQTGQIISTTEKVDASKVAIVIVDPWNYHWCMTACERVSAMVPRWNRALECARKLGMPVLWAPSDVVGMYSGYPQRERALAVRLVAGAEDARHAAGPVHRACRGLHVRAWVSPARSTMATMA